MIKFFRKIRQKMIKENKISNYLIYAIGEIVLVVIGILIALSINNWNNSINDNKIELKALKDLRKEIIYNHTKLLSNVNEKKQALESNEKFLESMRLNIVNSNSIIRSYGENTIDPTHGVLNSLLSTGKIDNIKNDSLKELLINWKDLFKNYREEEERHYNWLDLIVWPYLNEVIPNNRYSKTGGWIFYETNEVLSYYESAFKDIRFRNYHIENQKALNYVINESKEVILYTEMIEDLIEDEIKKKDNK